MKPKLTLDIRDAIRRSGLSIYRIAKNAGLQVSIVQRIASGVRDNMTIATAQKIAGAVGYRLELRPVKRPRRAKG